MSKKPKVVVTNPFVSQKGLDLLKEKCELIICQGNPPTKEEILKCLKGAEAIYWCAKYKVDQTILDAAGPNLKVLSTLSVGYDNIDVNLLKSKGIKIGNTPNVLNDSVAEVALALILVAAHRIQEGRAKIENNEWSPGMVNPGWMLGQQLSGSTVGIVGLGRIGYEIAFRLKAFKVKKLLYTGSSEKTQGIQLGAQFVSMDELLNKSDFVVISCPLTEETKHLFDKEKFKKMKSNAIVINISRGDVINQDDLIDALTNNTIAGAALDVMTPEPLPANHPLTKLPNCVLSPHLGSATRETRDAMSVLTAQNILAALEGNPMPASV